jgi:parallel beta-helix repeat protein
LEAVAASGRTFAGGDLLLLRSGHHGSPVIRGKHSSDVVIRPVSGADVTLGRVAFRDARHWRLRGVTVSPETAPTYKGGTLAVIASTTTHIVLEQCDLYSVVDSSGWAAADWVKWACNGVSISGAFNSSISNRFLNVKFGAQVSGVSNRLAHCVIQNFSADGIRGLGNYCTYESNVIQDSYKVDSNHDDAFQSWSVGTKGVGTGVVKGVVLRGNYILNYSDPKRPMRSTLQGIGCFDGFYEGWLIENNVVMVNHWHGISLYGARNCRIVNNTVTDVNTSTPGPPWIRIAKHKNGQSSTGNVVRNNLSPKFVIITGSALRQGNMVMDNPSRFFRDYAGRDLRLKSGSPAIDAGNILEPPLWDLLGVRRPVDGDGDGVARIDVGAYEYVR